MLLSLATICLSSDISGLREFWLDYSLCLDLLVSQNVHLMVQDMRHGLPSLFREPRSVDRRDWSLIGTWNKYHRSTMQNFNIKYIQTSYSHLFHGQKPTLWSKQGQTTLPVQRQALGGETSIPICSVPKKSMSLDSMATNCGAALKACLYL